jgi:hypothetical protein
MSRGKRFESARRLSQFGLDESSSGRASRHSSGPEIDGLRGRVRGITSRKGHVVYGAQGGVMDFWVALS